MAGATRRVIVLGSTGSIGVQTLEVIEHLNALHERGMHDVRHEVVGLAAGRNAGRLSAQSKQYPRARVAISNGAPTPGIPTIENAERLVREVECDLVVAAMSGSAGLPAVFDAVRLGRDVALANKESLVAAGALLVPAAEASGARLLPVDSEHSALWQCLAGREEPRTPGDGETSTARRDDAPPLRLGRSVERAWITASGGPFRGRPPHEVHDATPEQALRHPTWSMGPKNTVDSATLVNKALEIIEAHWLFGLPARAIGVLVHPQSVIHAIAEFKDGSAIAHLGAPDMRGPIQHALTWPLRSDAACRPLNWTEISRLDLHPPDEVQSRAIGLAYAALERGGCAGAIMSAANEAAVRAFLDGRLAFGRIVPMTAGALDSVPAGPLRSIADAMEAGRRGAAHVERAVGAPP